MGRGLELFYSESVKLENANKIPGEEKIEELAMEIDKVSGVERTDISFDNKEIVVKSKKQNGTAGGGTLF